MQRINGEATLSRNFEQRQAPMPIGVYTEFAVQTAIPAEYLTARSYVCGTCLDVTLPDDHKGIGLSLLVTIPALTLISAGYIFQTPYSDKGFWSMALSHGKLSSSENGQGPVDRITGYLEVDENLDTDLLLDKMKDMGMGEPDHPMILPAVFFDHYVRESARIFTQISKDIFEVEDAIRKGRGSTGEKYEDPDYGKLSRELNNCSQELEAVRRRVNFETRMAKILADCTPTNCHILKQKIQVLAEMSKNRDIDIELLPKRIERQLNLVSRRYLI
jgi:hypothetical protein